MKLLRNACKIEQLYLKYLSKNLREKVKSGIISWYIPNLTLMYRYGDTQIM